jgi:hypothetical protein
MAHTIKSVPCIGDTPPVVELPHDLQDETHESGFSEGSEQFNSDEDSDYGNCARFSVLQCVYTYNFYTSSEEKGQKTSSEEDETKCG